MNVTNPVWARLGRTLLTLCLCAAGLSAALAQTRAGTPEQEQRLAEFHKLRKANDLPAAKALLDALVAEGFPAAQLQLAEEHLEGGGPVPKDQVAALRLFERAAEGGNVTAMNRAGWMYLDGIGIDKNPAAALKWYQRAAEAGDAVSANYVGYMVDNGIGTAASGKEAVRWWRQAAKAKNASAMNNLGIVLTKGRSDLPAQADEGHYWSVMAAVNGHDGAKNRLVGEGYRSPVEVLKAINTIVSQSGGRYKVANFKDNGIDGGTLTLYSSVSTGSVGKEEVTWMMDFGTRPDPALRTTIAAKFQKSHLRPDYEGPEWRKKILAAMQLGVASPDHFVWDGDLK
ncbi:sel1 repeat family protein [Ideonella sp. 4Y16]|uniref:tetratricopeptide repeat protein n=1 Tax=Ideonella alba TaxID=2824118 RepID=UPI001B37DDF2|nr:tetratricopeptide repeat protein [Ideonella alba]MBQ0943216.1 sel1 repeat family protein [Ideonella alba]